MTAPVGPDWAPVKSCQSLNGQARTFCCLGCPAHSVSFLVIAASFLPIASQNLKGFRLPQLSYMAGCRNMSQLGNFPLTDLRSVSVCQESPGTSAKTQADDPLFFVQMWAVAQSDCQELDLEYCRLARLLIFSKPTCHA